MAAIIHLALPLTYYPTMGPMLVILLFWLCAKMCSITTQPHLPLAHDYTVTSATADITQGIPSLGLCSRLSRLRGLQIHNSPYFIPSDRHAEAITNLLVLILCGDIQSNPGPRTELAHIFPCAYCDLPVDFGQKALCCDECDVWLHKSCLHMRTTAHHDLETNVDINWYCPRCKTRNSSLYHVYEFSISTRNSFSVLSSIREDDVFTSPPSGRPIAQSSPLGTQQSARPVSIHSSVGSTTSVSDTGSSSNSTQDLPHKGKNWRTVVVNINGIRGKIACVENLIEYARPDAIMISETKLRKEVSTSEVIPNAWGYTVYHKYRPNSDGGGVMLLVKDSYISQQISYPGEGEIIWVEVLLKNGRKLLLSSVYRPPDGPTAQLDLFEQSLKDCMPMNDPNNTVFIGGDFNCGDIDCENYCVFQNSNRKSIHNSLLRILDDFHLSQIISCATRGDNLLDLFITNQPGIVKTCTVIPGYSDHEMAVADCELNPVISKKKARPIQLFSKANWDELKLKASGFRDEFLSSRMCDIEQQWSRLKSFIHNILTSIPSKLPSTKRHVPWINRSIQRLCRKKQRLYRKPKRDHKNSSWSKYRSCKRNCTQQLRRARSGYISEVIGAAFEQQDTKPFWKFIKSCKNDSPGVAPLKSRGVLHSDSGTKAELLNAQFRSVFTKEDLASIPRLEGDNYPSMDNITVAVEGVEKLLRNIKAHKASGPDNIPCRLLKELASELAPCLTRIFQESLSSGQLPDDWKKARIAPAFKKGSTCLAENYRPISLTCVCCKLLEHIICSQIHKHLNKYDILTSLQHGFRSRHSCESQLITTIHDLMLRYDSKEQIDIAVLDFSKAFDTVPHERLLKKLMHYGIDGQTWSWIAAFLRNRTQCVVVDSETSSSTRVESGVPQGTVLGPLLFQLYINDLPDNVTSQVRLFADDCLLYRSVGTIQDQLNLQHDLTSLHEWSLKMGYEF